jgi:hypothetical protein
MGERGGEVAMVDVCMCVLFVCCGVVLASGRERLMVGVSNTPWNVTVRYSVCVL